METSKKQRVYFLDWMRMIAPLMVMIVHGCECYYSDDFNFHFDSDEGRLATGFIGGLVRSCVPVFVMASAYLLVPIKTDTFTFFKKRAARILCPFIFFLLLYASLPAAWGLFEWSDVPGQMAHVLLNFHPSGSHLWFIYMLIGLYLLMPMISPWLERCTRREEEFYLGVWLFTTTFYHWHEQFGRVFGECEWNPYAIFYHFSGFIGYVIMAHYIRKYLDWSKALTYKVCIPGFLITYALMVWSFLSRSHWAANPQGLEMDWQMTSTLVALNSFFVFMLFKTINYHEGKVYKVVSSFSAMSYGMYLMHMLILPHFWNLFYPTSLPVGAAQILTAVCAYLTSYVVARILSIPKWGKYLIG